MLSSRMRTGRTLTVFRCLVIGSVSPKKAEIKKKSPPPKKLGGPPLTPPSLPPQNWRPPQKIGDPPKNWSPPEKLETSPEKLETPRDQTPPPPPGTDLQGMLGYPLPLPLWTEFLTHACENIILAKTSFRPVIMFSAKENKCRVSREKELKFIVGGERPVCEWEA